MGLAKRAQLSTGAGTPMAIAGNGQTTKEVTP